IYNIIYEDEDPGPLDEEDACLNMLDSTNVPVSGAIEPIPRVGERERDLEAEREAEMERLRQIDREMAGENSDDEASGEGLGGFPLPQGRERERDVPSQSGYLTQSAPAYTASQRERVVQDAYHMRSVKEEEM
ncbi:hypothetical protein KIPB_011886, partial [Kipferlia bialata]